MADDIDEDADAGVALDAPFAELVGRVVLKAGFVDGLIRVYDVEEREARWIDDAHERSNDRLVVKLFVGDEVFQSLDDFVEPVVGV